jgi:hypothetical protein
MRALALCCVIFAACGPNHRNNGDAQGGDCNNGDFRCNATNWETCQGGMWTIAVECPVACADGVGCVTCTPGSMTCMNGDVYGCDSSGNPSGLIQQCTGNQLCDTGVCVDACAAAALNRSYVGCEYWAADLENALQVVDMQTSLYCDPIFGPPGTINVTMAMCYNASGTTHDNGCTGSGCAEAGTCDPPNNSCPTGYTCSSQAVCILDAQHSPFGIVVSNPQAKSVDVTVTAPDGTTNFTTTIQAGAVQALMPQQHSIADQSLFQTGKQKKAYKVTSTLPIVAYQFNPLNNSNVFSNDASLLIPRTAWDIDYYGMAWPTADNRNPAPGINDWYGYLAIVSYKDGTVVQFTPTAAVQASATQASYPAGMQQTVTLNAYEVLNLESVASGDLTGTLIHSMDGITPIGVFGGNVAADFGESTPPDGTHTLGPCCADHLEEMLFPTSTWGKTFAIARSKQRLNEPDYIRVMAQKAGTAVTFNPSPSATVSGNCGNLGPGQFCDVKIAGDTSISSTEPVLVGHYLESAIWQDPLLGDAVPPTGSGGDPSMAIAVPVEQYRTDYAILIPMAYGMNYLSISAPPSGAVLVDGNMQTMTSFAGGAYRSVIVSVTAGQHKIQCPGTCGVLVYGYDDAVSYMFAGGLDLKQIVVQ